MREGVALAQLVDGLERESARLGGAPTPRRGLAAVGIARPAAFAVAPGARPAVVSPGTVALGAEAAVVVRARGPAVAAVAPEPAVALGAGSTLVATRALAGGLRAASRGIPTLAAVGRMAVALGAGAMRPITPATEAGLALGATSAIIPRTARPLAVEAAGALGARAAPALTLPVLRAAAPVVPEPAVSPASPFVAPRAAIIALSTGALRPLAATRVLSALGARAPSLALLSAAVVSALSRGSVVASAPLGGAAVVMHRTTFLSRPAARGSQPRTRGRPWASFHRA